MNEKVFRPLFMKCVDFCLIENTSPEKKYFLFKLMNSLLDSLKSIFAPYVGNILDTLLLVLSEASQTELTGINLDIWLSSLSILKKSFMHDNESTIFSNLDLTTQHRFDRVLAPLLSQLEVVDLHGVNYIDRMSQHVIPCIGAMITAHHSEASKKELNHQILLKTRHSNTQVRYAALLAFSELYTRLGEEMLVCFPEAIPFLAELFEDDDENIESLCKEVGKQIQEYLGEPIEGYFAQ